MSKSLTISAILLACATQANALSCLRPDLAKTFDRLHASEDVYRIVVGTLDIPNRPKSSLKPEPAKANGVFKGQYLGLNGLGKEQRFDVTVETTCIAAWCGNFPEPTGRRLIFLKQSESGPTLTISACPDGTFVIPTAKKIGFLSKCLRNGKCIGPDPGLPKPLD